MSTYTAFGLSIHSDMQLPALLRSNNKKIDIQIIRGKVNKKGLDAPEQTRLFSQLAVNELWLHVPNIAWFYVSNGNKIIVEAENGSDEQSIILYILGTCMGAIMHQRNRLVIHGNAIRVGEGCVVFAGQSGNGKSTLAAAFHQRGYSILADDLAVIDEQGKVQPSYPQIKLWHDTAKKLEIEISRLKRIRLQIDKYAYPIKDGFCTIPLPIKAIYILNNHNQDEFLFEPIKGIAKFNPLKNNTYRINHLDGLGLKKQHFKRCSQLANQIQLTRITRPNDSFELNTLVELIEADLTKKELYV